MFFFSVLYLCELNIFWFYTVGWTKHDIWRHDLQYRLDSHGAWQDFQIFCLLNWKKSNKAERKCHFLSGGHRSHCAATLAAVTPCKLTYHIELEWLIVICSSLVWCSPVISLLSVLKCWAVSLSCIMGAAAAPPLQQEMVLSPRRLLVPTSHPKRRRWRHGGMVEKEGRPAADLETDRKRLAQTPSCPTDLCTCSTEVSQSAVLLYGN